MIETLEEPKIHRKSPGTTQSRTRGTLFDWTLGGLWVGLILAFWPRAIIFSEVRNFQIFLLEKSYQGLGRVFPPFAMRFWGTFYGEVLLLSLFGILLGWGIGIIFSFFASRKKEDKKSDSLSYAVGFVSGTFAFLMGILWSRIVFIHSNNARMFSGKGLLLIAVCASLAFLAGGVIFLIMKQLGRLRVFNTKSNQIMMVLVLSLFIVVHPVFSFFYKTPHVAVSQTKPVIKQVVLLGGDGATWNVMEPMVREGRLPHLARLMKEGSWGGIKSTLPWKSPILWTSIATGKRSNLHGIKDFVIRDTVLHEVFPTTASHRKVKALWDIVSDAGLRVSMSGWYGFTQAEPVNGTSISERFVFLETPEQVFPRERFAEIKKIADEVSAEDAGPRDERVAARLGVYLLEKDKPNLTLIYLREIDDTQHSTWRQYSLAKGDPLARLLYPPLRPEEASSKALEIETAYQELDKTLGKILEQSGKETAVLVLSDHGAGIKALGELRFSLNPVLEQWGFLKSVETGKKLDWPQTKVYDATKRAWYEDRELFINKREGNPLGKEISLEQQRLILEPLAEKLKTLKTSSAESLFSRVEVEPAENGDYRILVRFNVGLRARENESIQGEGIQIPLSRLFWLTDLTGTHRLDGVLMMAGPGIKKNAQIVSASILDITPTVLYMLGLPVADDMEGRVLFEVFEPGFRQNQPFKRVPTYEADKKHIVSPSGKKLQQNEELLEKLRSLGYV